MKAFQRGDGLATEIKILIVIVQQKPRLLLFLAFNRLNHPDYRSAVATKLIHIQKFYLKLTHKSNTTPGDFQHDTD